VQYMYIRIRTCIMVVSILNSKEINILKSTRVDLIWVNLLPTTTLLSEIMGLILISMGNKSCK
jgi:hypothetical protein